MYQKSTIWLEIQKLNQYANTSLSFFLDSWKDTYLEYLEKEPYYDIHEMTKYSFHFQGPKNILDYCSVNNIKFYAKTSNILYDKQA